MANFYQWLELLVQQLSFFLGVCQENGCKPASCGSRESDARVDVEMDDKAEERLQSQGRIVALKKDNNND